MSGGWLGEGQLIAKLLTDFAASVVLSAKTPASGCRGVWPVTVLTRHACLAQVTAAVVFWGDFKTAFRKDRANRGYARFERQHDGGCRLVVHRSSLRITSIALREASRMMALMLEQTGINVTNGIQQA
jgi:hypothetical protein